MISYKDTMFCRGAGCQSFKGCPRALTEEVSIAANKWWGFGDGDGDKDTQAPISTCADPRKMECYVAPKRRGKVIAKKKKT